MIGKHLIAVVLLASVCLSGVAVYYVWMGGQTAQTEESTQTGENLENFVVYELGFGLATGSDTVMIKDDGTIIEEYISISFISGVEENKVTKMGKLTENEFQEFTALVVGANVFEFENRYIEENTPTDADSANVTFAIDGQTKRIFIYPASYRPENMPEKLTEIIQKISEFKNKL